MRKQDGLAYTSQANDRGTIMSWNRISMFASAIVICAVGGSRVIADEREGEAGKDQKWLGVLSTKLGLSEQQREAIRKGHEECEKKACPIEQQIWAQVHAEMKAIKQQLSEQQQTAFTEAMKTMRHQEFDAMATKLGLNADQKQKLQAVCNEFEPKFEKLADSGEKGETAHQQFRDLRHQFIAAIRPELTPEQQAKLPFLIEEEHQRWRDPAVRREHLKAVLDKLDVSAEQRTKIKQINDSYEKVIQPLVNDLTQIRKEACDNMESQLTAEQREKLREIRKGYGEK